MGTLRGFATSRKSEGTEARILSVRVGTVIASTPPGHSRSSAAGRGRILSFFFFPPGEEQCGLRFPLPVTTEV